MEGVNVRNDGPERTACRFPPAAARSRAGFVVDGRGGHFAFTGDGDDRGG